MSTFTYVGESGRYYPDLKLAPNPGDIADLSACPDDGRWIPTPAVQETPAAPAAPAPSEEKK